MNTAFSRARPLRLSFAAAFLLLGALLPLSGCGSRPPTVAVDTTLLRDGDVLFQSLPHGPLVDAIEGSTHSPFSHCGIAHQTPRGWVVLEAIGPVKETPLDAWVGQARDGAFSVYRVREPYRVHIPAMIAAAKTYFGRPYDIRYELDDEKIYCSELVFKAYRSASGRELGRLQKLRELDWKPFQAVIVAIERGPVPLDREMITPRSLSEAADLELVKTNAR